LPTFTFSLSRRNYEGPWLGCTFLNTREGHAKRKRQIEGVIGDIKTVDPVYEGKTGEYQWHRKGYDS
jgi:hypothetical protein